MRERNTKYLPLIASQVAQQRGRGAKRTNRWISNPMEVCFLVIHHSAFNPHYQDIRLCCHPHPSMHCCPKTWHSTTTALILLFTFLNWHRMMCRLEGEQKLGRIKAWWHIQTRLEACWMITGGQIHCAGQKSVPSWWNLWNELVGDFVFLQKKLPMDTNTSGNLTLKLNHIANLSTKRSSKHSAICCEIVVKRCQWHLCCVCFLC